MAREEPDIVVVSSKGQVVIPHTIREKLDIKPKTKLLVYDYDDGFIMKKIKVPEPSEELREIYKKIDARTAHIGELTDQEITEIIQKHRKQTK